MIFQPARRLALSAVACLGVAFGATLGVSPAAAQDADAPSAVPTTQQYRAVLQEISDRRTTLAQREFYLAQQQAEIARLEAGVAEAAGSSAREDLLPLIRDMVAGLERVMVADLPFRVERRFALLDDLRDDLRADDASTYDTFRRAMELAGLEVEYGLSVGSYVGQNPVNPGGRYAACVEDVESPACDLSDEQSVALETGALLDDLRDQIYDGNYIHYGRLALLYLERDSSEGYRYNAGSESWEPLSNSELLGLRQNVRIARGESAISTMTAPIRIGEGGADAS
ncbi:MAG: DUF3450 family protein [Litorimonas sp.]